MLCAICSIAKVRELLKAKPKINVLWQLGSSTNTVQLLNCYTKAMKTLVIECKFFKTCIKIQNS